MSMMKKVLLAIVALALISAVLTPSDSGSHSAVSSNPKPVEQAQSTPAVEQQAAKSNTTLADVQKWYEAQMDGVAGSLVDLINSNDSVSGAKITSKKLIFGDPWGEVYYSFKFTCNVKGQKHSGEARGFLPYGGSTIEWFHFEIFSNTSSVSLVEHYDDAYDDIVEDYYKELVKQYK